MHRFAVVFGSRGRCRRLPARMVENPAAGIATAHLLANGR